MISIISKKNDLIKYHIHASFSNSEFIFYEDFGLFLWKKNDSLLSMKAGKIGQHGMGGHNHIDFGSLTLFYKGKSILNDPGTYTYTSDRQKRDYDRSEVMHNSPKVEGLSLSKAFNGTFGMQDIFKCRAVEISPEIVTVVHNGYGFVIGRTIKIKENLIKVCDFHYGDNEICLSPALEALPIYKGYGISYE
jgi:hypothetical protein